MEEIKWTCQTQVGDPLNAVPVEGHRTAHDPRLPWVFVL